MDCLAMSLQATFGPEMVVLIWCYSSLWQRVICAGQGHFNYLIIRPLCGLWVGKWLLTGNAKAVWCCVKYAYWNILKAGLGLFHFYSAKQCIVCITKRLFFHIYCCIASILYIHPYGLQAPLFPGHCRLLLGFLQTRRQQVASHFPCYIQLTLFHLRIKRNRMVHSSVMLTYWAQIVAYGTMCTHEYLCICLQSLHCYNVTVITEIILIAFPYFHYITVYGDTYTFKLISSNAWFNAKTFWGIFLEVISDRLHAFIDQTFSLCVLFCFA